jgi:hypothetical protein
MEAAKDKVKHIYETLPHLNCGLCGFESCGQFAKAVAEGRASPFGCKQDPWVGDRIRRIIGGRVPGMGFTHIFRQGFFTQRARPPASLRSLRAEVDELSKRLEGILERMDSLGKGGSIVVPREEATARAGRGKGVGKSLGRGGARGRRKRMP